jgi:predicted AAA+ superfamily ATPase
MLFSVSRFSFKVREQVAQNKKIYAIDNGLITSTGFNASPNTGRLAENAVAIALEKQRLQGSMRYFFWKNSRHEEVDFVCMDGSRVCRCIQVCWNIDNPKTLDRETRSLVKAGNELGCGTLIIITERIEKKERYEWSGLQAEISFVPLWKWLVAET